MKTQRSFPSHAAPWANLPHFPKGCPLEAQLLGAPVLVGPPTACHVVMAPYPGYGLAPTPRQAHMANMFKQQQRQAQLAALHSSDEESMTGSAPSSPAMNRLGRRRSCDSVTLTTAPSSASFRDAVSSAASSPTKPLRRSRSVERALSFSQPRGSRASSVDSAHVSRDGLVRSHSSGSLDLLSASYADAEAPRPLINASCNGLCVDESFAPDTASNDGVFMLTEADVDYMLYQAEIKTFSSASLGAGSSRRLASKRASSADGKALGADIVFKRVSTCDSHLALNPDAAAWAPGSRDQPAAAAAECASDRVPPTAQSPWRG
eukprot:TRINITY_DN4161_c2_g1_i1.p1 TRINITY_DN4161_c2_g1~~TRINITY_DN4161_c2_g1_i1.p1  ORF type:complete len:320 (+),score=44.77 TRINITY_DN4161_c2_g1_i1:138-1097(+)